MSVNAKTQISTGSTKNKQHISDIVDYWAKTGKLSLRPSDKQKLKRLIHEQFGTYQLKEPSTLSVPLISGHNVNLQEDIVEAIAQLEEPFPGLVNKQRAINACYRINDLVCGDHRSIAQTDRAEMEQ